MNKIKLLFSVLLLGIVTSFSCMGQLSGIRTIGGDAPDYTTFEAAISDLNVQGVGPGGLTFLVRSGTYNESHSLSITDINTEGTSFVLFQPDEDAEVVVNFDLPNFAWGFRIENSKKITFSGVPYNSSDQGVQAMTINGNRIEQDDQFFTVYISNGSEDSGFANLVITHEDNHSRTGFSLPVYFSTYNVETPQKGMRNLFVRNCLIIGGNTYGIFLDGDPDKKVINTKIIGNEIKDFARFGVVLQSNADSTLIDGNEIYQVREGRSAVYGINLGGLNHYTTISNNYIHSLIPGELAGLRGIQLNTGSTHNTIYNNAIHVIPAETHNASYGLYILGGDHANNKIYYNSIYIGGHTTRNVSSYALRVVKDFSNDILVNNIFVNARTGGTANHYAMALKAITFAESDYNFFSVMSEDPNDNRYVARIGTGATSLELNTLADLLNAPGYAPRDVNSLTGDPQWVLPELNISAESPVIGSGVPVDFIAYDILGNPRNPVAPDMGAYEYVSCLPPAELFVQNITTTTASLSWSVQSIHDQWDVIYGQADFDPETQGILLEGITSQPVLLEDLLPATDYEAYVRAVCGEEVTNWSEPTLFTTQDMVYVITATAGENGFIEPAGEIEVDNGEDQLFSFIAQQGYQVHDVVVDGQSIGAQPSYLFENVQQNHSIHVTFEPVILTITASAGENGTITPAGEVEVVYGAGQLFTFAADSDFFIADVEVDGVSVGVAEEWLFENVTENHSIHVAFAPHTYNLLFVVEDQDGLEISDATVEIDDVVNPEGDYLFEGLLPGVYGYTVTLAGYFPSSGTVEIVDQNTEVVVVLVRDDTSVRNHGVQVNVYPNPASHYIIVESMQKIDELRLMDLNGKVLYVHNPQSGKHSIDVKRFSAGVYYLNVVIDGEISGYKIIVNQ